MTTLVGKTGFEQVENSAPVFGFGEALDAAIADGDFRTYVLLCQWAWQEHPEAEEPFTERTYEQMAALHPAHRRPTPETVRGRIYRLTRAGLARRERAGRTIWRTYPVLETDTVLRLDGMQRPTQSRALAPKPEGAGSVQMDSGTNRSPSGQTGAPHPESGGEHHAHTQGHGRAERRHPASLAVGQARTQASDRAQDARPDSVGGQHRHTQTCGAGPAEGGQHEQTQSVGRVLGAHPQSTQSAGRASTPHSDGVGGHGAHTQTTAMTAVGGERDPIQPVGEQQTRTRPAAPAPLGGPPVHTQTPGRVERVHPQSLGGQPQHTQTDPAQGVSGEQPHTQKLAEIEAPTSGREALDGKSASRGWGLGTHPDAAPSRARVRERASVLTGTDPLSFSSSHTGRDHQSVSTEGTDAHTAQHKVLSLVTVPQGYETLAVTLATMEPQGMNYEGIKECLAQPELTQAWFDYVQRTEETIYNPAAYIRHGVRSGRKPPTPEAKKTQKQAHDPNDFGWDDPTIPAELYAKYQFANGPYLPPHLREKQGAQPTH